MNTQKDLQIQLDILFAHVDNLITEAEILNLKIKELKEIINPPLTPEEQWQRIYDQTRHK